jgi:hypothetical protein
VDYGILYAWTCVTQGEAVCTSNAIGSQPHVEGLFASSAMCIQDALDFFLPRRLDPTRRHDMAPHH